MDELLPNASGRKTSARRMTLGVRATNANVAGDRGVLEAPAEGPTRWTHHPSRVTCSTSILCPTPTAQPKKLVCISILPAIAPGSRLLTLIAANTPAIRHHGPRNVSNNHLRSHCGCDNAVLDFPDAAMALEQPPRSITTLTYSPARSTRSALVPPRTGCSTSSPAPTPPSPLPVLTSCATACPSSSSSATASSMP